MFLITWTVGYVEGRKLRSPPKSCLGSRAGSSWVILLRGRRQSRARRWRGYSSGPWVTGTKGWRWRESKSVSVEYLCYFIYSKMRLQTLLTWSRMQTMSMQWQRHRYRWFSQPMGWVLLTTAKGLVHIPTRWRIRRITKKLEESSPNPGNLKND